MYNSKIEVWNSMLVSGYWCIGRFRMTIVHRLLTSSLEIQQHAFHSNRYAKRHSIHHSRYHISFRASKNRIKKGIIVEKPLYNVVAILFYLRLFISEGYFKASFSFEINQNKKTSIADGKVWLTLSDLATLRPSSSLKSSSSGESGAIRALEPWYSAHSNLPTPFRVVTVETNHKTFIVNKTNKKKYENENKMLCSLFIIVFAIV